MEAVLGAVLGALKPLGKWLMPKVEERFSYLFSNKEHIEELEKEVKQLGNKKIDIDTRVQRAENQGEVVIQEVDAWQKQAEQILADSHKFLERTRNSDAKCCFKLCYNISYLYKNSKEAAALHKVVTDRYREAEGFIVVATPPECPQITVPYTTASSNGFESRDRVLAQIVDLLENDEVNVIGIYGMGGVGKTTLVDKLILQAQEQKLFVTVAKAVVSKTPNFMDVQNQIADRINFNLDAASKEGRADKLQQVLSRRLEEDKILVILDDIWEALDFTVQVGIPRKKGCKVVITSRNKNVLNARPINADKLIEVGVLKEEESRRLFMMSLGDHSSAIGNDSQLANIVDDLLKFCEGLPLAIVTLAGVLKEKDQYIWEDVAKQLKEHSGKEIEGMEEKVWNTIELSFNSLKEKKAQMLFLLCSLFPEDALIRVQKLASYGLALHLFGDNCRLDDAMRRVHALADRLISCSLLLSAVDNYGTSCVKMHDVIREVAINIASRDYNFFIGTDWPKTDYLANKYAISLKLDRNRNTGGSALGNCGWQCSNLQIFCLWLSYSDTTISIDFLKGMEKLQVLDIANNNFRSPPTFQPSVNSTIEQLTNLGYLCIGGYLEEGLPTFKDLIHLKVLDLSRYWKLSSIPTGAIASLSQLEGLLLNFNVSRVNLVELQLCRNLKVLQAPLSVVDLSQMLDNVVSNVQSIMNSLSSFEINIAKSTEADYDKSLWRVGNGKYQDKLFPKAIAFEDIDICSPINFPSMTKLWEGLQVLYCYKVEGLPSLMGIKFSSLRDLQVTRCRDMKYIVEPHVLSKLDYLQLFDLPQLEGIFGQDGALWKNLFPALRKIILDSLPNFKGSTKTISAAYDVQYLFGCEDALPAVEEMNIRHMNCDEIWHCPLQDGAFSQLRVLRVFGLPRMRSLFPSLTFCTQVPLRLETLEIANCQNLQVVISGAREGDGDERVANETTNMSVMPCLEEITLLDLQCLFCFYEGGDTLKFPLLRNIEEEMCPKLESFAPRSPITPRLIDDEGFKVDDLNTFIKKTARPGNHRRIRIIMRRKLLARPPWPAHAPWSCALMGHEKGY